MFLYQSKPCEWCYDWFAGGWHSSIIHSQEEGRMQVFSIFTPQLFPENLQCDFEDISAFESVIVRRAESVLHRLFTYDIFRPLFENLYPTPRLEITLWGVLSAGHVHRLVSVCWIFEGPSGLLTHSWFCQSTYATVMDKIKSPEHVLVGRISELR